MPPAVPLRRGGDDRFRVCNYSACRRAYDDNWHIEGEVCGSGRNQIVQYVYRKHGQKRAATTAVTCFGSGGKNTTRSSNQSRG